MADEFVPTTEDVRLVWTDSQTGGEYGYLDDGQQARAEFDRWLAEHDAEVREQVAQEIESVARGCEGDFEGGLFYAAAIVRGV